MKEPKRIPLTDNPRSKEPKKIPLPKLYNSDKYKHLNEDEDNQQNYSQSISELESDPTD